MPGGAHTGGMDKLQIQAFDHEPAPGTATCNSVYIVEDSDSIRARLVDMLGEVDGLRIVGEAESADSAVAGILGTQPDAVVLDIHLTGGSGLDVLRQVHRMSPEIMFIVLTNYPTPQYRHSCMLAGASHFLDKSSEFRTVAALLSAPGACSANRGSNTLHPSNH